MSLNGLFVLDSDAFGAIYGPEEQAAISSRVRLVAPPQTRHTILTRPELLSDVQVLFSGWGAPVIDADFLNAAPNLRAIFYGAGAIGYWLTDAVWDRGITVTTASLANALPVAEYTLATILFSLKHGWPLARETRRRRAFPDRDGAPGCYGSTVGLISLGMIARQLLNLLKHFDLNVLVYDPFVSPAEAERLGVEKVSLDELFDRSDVASLHTPLLPETIGMITGEHLARLKRGATFINTARGEIVRQDEMIDVLRRRGDLQAVLDVTADEPPPADSPLYQLENVMLTPHIAGSAGNERRRMGRYMVEELERYLAGQPLKWQLTRDMVWNTSHRPIVSVKIAKAFRRPEPSEVADL
jgi:phosphoglycerate dehydrogenase-like enzyme